MKNIQNIKLSKNSTIKEALKIIDSGAMQIALVVDADDKLLGTLADGDIRRALLNGLDLNSSIETIFSKKPLVSRVGDTKEEILKSALLNKVHQIPILNDNNQVIGIQDIEELVKPTKKNNLVVLMVGGLGTRLRPLTESMPKPMLKVGNKPILQTIVEKFAESGFENIVMCVNYKSHIIQDFFGNGARFGVNIEYVLEEQRLGTAGALSLLNRNIDEPFFVMNGDLLTNINFVNMLDYHISNQADATMGVMQYDFQVPYGVVKIDDIEIRDIEEKPTSSFFINGGVYILNPSTLEHIPKNEFFDMPTLFKKIIEDKKKAISFPIREYWLDIGRMEEFEKANDEYRRNFL